MKLFYWSVPEGAKIPIRDFFERADHLISFVVSKKTDEGAHLDVLRFSNKTELPPYPTVGQLWTPDDDNTIFWFDGKNWNLIKDDNKKYIGPVTLQIRFHPQQGQSESLLTTGKIHNGDSIYVRYLSDNKGIIGFDYWGSHGYSSEPFDIDPSRIYLLEISFGSFYPNVNLGKLNKSLIVKLDGKIIIDERSDFHPIFPEEIAVGVNQIDCAVCGQKFTGDILEARRLGVKI